MSAGIANMIYGVFEPTLSLRLTEFGMGQSYQGIIIAIIPFMYMFGSLLHDRVFPKWVEPRLILMGGALILSVSVPLVGPFFEDKNIPVMCLGLVLAGSMLGSLCISPMTENMAVAFKLWPGCDLMEANSLLSGIMICMVNVGLTVGSFLAGVIYQVVGFRVLCDIIGAMCLIFLIAYFIAANGCDALSQTCKNYRNRNKEKSEVEKLAEEALDFRYSAALKTSVISSKKARLLSSLSQVVRST